MQARKLASKGSTLVLKPRADVTRSPKQGCHEPHKKDLSTQLKVANLESMVSVHYTTLLGHITMYHNEDML